VTLLVGAWQGSSDGCPLELSEHSIGDGGDFDAVRDPVVDRSDTRQRWLASAALQTRANNVGLTDVWRLINSDRLLFFFFLPEHRTFSIIDHIFTFPRLCQNMSHVTLLLMSFCDHKGCLCLAVISSVSSHAAGWCFANAVENECFKTKFGDAFN